MADLLVSSAPAEPVRICPACGDVLVSGVCAACAPPPARAYHDRAPLSSLGKGLVDSRRAAAEWSVRPEDLDPHTRKAHPSQLRSAPRDFDLPEPTVRGKRQTQVYKKGGGAPLAAPVPAQARSWTMPEPRPEPHHLPHRSTHPERMAPHIAEPIEPIGPDQPQTASTARHARPVSPLRQVSGPVPSPTPNPPAPAPAAAEPAFIAEPEPVAAEPAFIAEPEPIAAEPPPVSVHPEPNPAIADLDLDLDLAPAARPRVPPVAWWGLAAAALAGLLVALL